MPSNNTDLNGFIADIKQRVNRTLSLAIKEQRGLIDARNPSLSKLQEACLYSIENGGKRLRPAIFHACCQALNVSDSHDLDLISAAIECIHSYSLVHDDLPAMDDDALRRGKPTCHIAFDEATAILVGDGLQALAFELITQCQQMSATQQVQLINALAKAAGNLGMVGGQMIDLEATGKSITAEQLEQMHQLKTGVMIRVCAQLACICGNADTQAAVALEQYSANIGLAFQVHDDILDIESSTEVLGKTQGADSELNKQTYPALLGLEQAKKKRDKLILLAKAALADTKLDNQLLIMLAELIVQRDY